jgi:hypothetical protein
MAQAWAVDRDSDVHVALDRECFTSYTPFQTTVYTLSGLSPMPRIGIGDVELKVVFGDWGPGSKSPYRLVLHDVLHAAEGPCNILQPALCSIDSGVNMLLNGNGGVVRDENFEVIAMTRPGNIPLLMLQGQSENGSWLPEWTTWNHAPLISVTWPLRERNRWRAYKQEPGAATPSAHAPQTPRPSRSA